MFKATKDVPPRKRVEPVIIGFIALFLGFAGVAWHYFDHAFELTEETGSTMPAVIADREVEAADGLGS